MRQQRRRVSMSQRKANSQPGVVLALTEAQQQQRQQEHSQPCNTGMAPTTGRLCAQLGVHCVSQLVSKEDEADAAGPTGKGQDEHQLWQNLAEALQDKQSCRKLAQLTVTLLGRM